jgi:streptogramin lyase
LGCGSASVSGITSGPDGNVWYFDVGKYTVGRVTPNGAITEFPVPAAGSGSEAIIGAPDGNIWMVARLPGPPQSDWILKVSPAGVVTRFPLTDGVGPEGITWGPDGNIWFTEIWTGRVGRMTPAGVVTEFSLPSANSAPRGIVTGPDHNLWILESAWQHTAIARMTTSGAAIEFPLGGTPTDQLQPSNIVVGPDGNLWFNETDRMGRITPAGVVTQFPMKGNSPLGLAVGADANLWFTSMNANVVGRMSPNGVVRLFPLPRRNAQPIGIAAGSDGRMWFTEAGVSTVGSIGLTVPEITLSSRVLNFGSVSGPTMHVAISNTGDGPLRVAAATVAGPDQAMFNVTSDTCSRHTVGLGAQCRIDVAFSPGSASGIAAAYLNLVDNASGSPHFVSLLGRLPDCRLPLFPSSSSQGQGQGQFLDPATGHLADDPSAAFVAEGTSFRSVMTPALYGTQPASYDQIAKRWVPAQTEAVSPDGARYAYVNVGQPGGNQIHVVDVATGRDRVLPVSPGYWGILAFAPEGVYVNQAYEGIGPGLALVNPDTGAVQTVFSDSPVEVVAGHVAWIGGRDATDPLPQPPGIGGAFNQIQSRDLNTSATTTWIYHSGASLYVPIATESSALVGGYDSQGSYLWFVGAPGQAELIAGPELADPQPYHASRIDGSRVWMGTPDGLYLWTHRTGPILIADTVANPAGVCA